MVKRVEIQPFKVGDVQHYRAREEGKEDYVFEIEPRETLDQFRWRIMDEVEDGCIFLFQEEVKFA